MQNAIKKRKPGKLKARLAMAAFVVVAVAGMTLTSAGLVHVVAQAVAPPALVANADVTSGIEVLR